MEIEHDKERNRFFIKSGGDESFISYALGADSIDFNHTFVPPAFRGRGIAEKLVVRALQFAKENGLKVYASCSYVAAYLKRHPEHG